MASLTQRQVGQIMDDLVRQGATVHKRSKNVHRIVFPNGSTAVVHSSPSDTQWHHHLRRATVRAGLHWPGADRKQLKSILREKAGRHLVASFITEYGGHVSESVSQDAQDRIAKELTGKSETRIPVLVERTGISQPTVMKALIRLGWLQRSEKVVESIETSDGRRTGARRAYWAPAPETVLSEVRFKGRDVELIKSGERFLTKRTSAIVTVSEPGHIVNVEPVVDETTPQTELAEEIEELRGGPIDLEAAFAESDPIIEPTPPIPADEPDEPELEPGADDITIEGPATKSDDEWFAEAARQEARAIEAERQSRRNALEARRNAEALEELQARHTALVATYGRTDDGSWSAPGIAELPESTTIAELFATLRLMGLTPEIRLSRNEEAA